MFTIESVSSQSREWVLTEDARQFVEAERLTSRDQVWCAYNAQRVRVGYCAAHRAGVEGWLWLARAYVCPDARGNGLQRRMLRVREAYARKIGAPGCWTYTVISNTHSSNNLIRSGYETFWPSSSWRMWDGVIYWRKQLRSTK